MKKKYRSALEDYSQEEKSSAAARIVGVLIISLFIFGGLAGMIFEVMKPDFKDKTGAFSIYFILLMIGMVGLMVYRDNREE